MIVVAHQHPKRRFPKRETLRTVGRVLKRNPGAFERISVVFTNDRFMRRINRVYLNHDRVTDVIAFPLKDAMGAEGELYVNLDRAARQAVEAGVSMGEEVRRLLIHGTLHLLGYRDKTRAQKARMTRLEDRYLDALRKRNEYVRTSG